MATDLNRHLAKEKIYMAEKHIKRCATWYVIREILIETTKHH